MKSNAYINLQTFKQEWMWQDHERFEVMVIPRYLKLETNAVKRWIIEKRRGRDWRKVEGLCDTIIYLDLLQLTNEENEKPTMKRLSLC